MKKVKKDKEPQINHHFVFVEVTKEHVWPEVVQWSESAWWPKECSMKFSRGPQENIQLGTEYTLKVKALLGPTCLLKISRLVPDSEIERTFIKGLIKGFEIVKIEESSNGTRIDYEMTYEIKGLVNKILWAFFYEKLHNANIELILKALSDYLVKTNQERVEKELEQK